MGVQSGPPALGNALTGSDISTCPSSALRLQAGARCELPAAPQSPRRRLVNIYDVGMLGLLKQPGVNVVVLQEALRRRPRRSVRRADDVRLFFVQRRSRAVWLGARPLGGSIHCKRTR